MNWQPYRMENPIMHYAWGSRGPKAFIPRLLGLENVEPNKPFAELWMGAHPSAPSRVVTAQGVIPLNELVATYPSEALGDRVLQKFGPVLPFLFKVLSAAEALSIQVHPNKKQARELHNRDPEHYPDENHKPEVAIALDSLDALVGLKSSTQIFEVCEKYPEVAALVGGKVSSGPPLEVFERIINLSIESPSTIADVVDKLVGRLSIKTEDERSFVETLFLDLCTKYSNDDVGLILLFLLEHKRLKTGDGMYIPAGVPHAYICGNIVECMANSDNVVRAGLTPKYKDVRTLLSIMDYSAKPRHFRTGGKATFTYDVPAEEFKVVRWMANDGDVFRGPCDSGPAVILVVDGKAYVRWVSESTDGKMSLDRGNSVFVPAIINSAPNSWRLEAVENTLIFIVTVPVSA
ncbi:MAG: mannose-6-phosphate isomerase, class I [Deltaproteobacteria bacterium]|nr:mannose-6-phosphate isomerase, class I [Deltaproteobacteria bacterium]